ncbi:MAG: alpha/beta hydrolase fold domain-containing protein [Kiritimatiellia bacterium]|nr:alpha/beta hydrolase fold domain-containing protein [Lentisphaerota bacterium]
MMSLQGAIGDDHTASETAYANVAYGPHELNTLNFWRAPGEGPRPLVVVIHGGGWTQGGASSSLGGGRDFLKKGISYATINYRLSSDAPLPAPVHDAARAIQYLRSRAEEWNIDKTRIAVTGGSAGGCSSLWLALHDDLADPDAEDPVLRESTRVAAAAVGNAQVSLDPKVVEEWLGPNILKHRMLWTSVGAKNIEEVLAHYDRYEPLFREFSPYNHLTADDPPLMMTYSHKPDLPASNANHAIHHPAFGLRLKEKSDALGHECHLLVKDGPQLSEYATTTEFLLEKLR